MNWRRTHKSSTEREEKKRKANSLQKGENRPMSLCQLERCRNAEELLQIQMEESLYKEEKKGKATLSYACATGELCKMKDVLCISCLCKCKKCKKIMHSVLCTWEVCRDWWPLSCLKCCPLKKLRTMRKAAEKKAPTIPKSDCIRGTKAGTTKA